MECFEEIKYGTHTIDYNIQKEFLNLKAYLNAATKKYHYESIHILQYKIILAAILKPFALSKFCCCPFFTRMAQILQMRFLQSENCLKKIYL